MPARRLPTGEAGIPRTAFVFALAPEAMGELRQRRTYGLARDVRRRWPSWTNCQPDQAFRTVSGRNASMVPCVMAVGQACERGTGKPLCDLWRAPAKRQLRRTISPVPLKFQSRAD